MSTAYPLAMALKSRRTPGDGFTMRPVPSSETFSNPVSAMRLSSSFLSGMCAGMPSMKPYASTNGSTVGSNQPLLPRWTSFDTANTPANISSAVADVSPAFILDRIELSRYRDTEEFIRSNSESRADGVISSPPETYFML